MAHRYIGRNIYELRKKRGWSQSDLARKLDKKTSTISRTTPKRKQRRIGRFSNKNASIRNSSFERFARLMGSL
mgnify:CR=1 FL=1